MTSPSVNSLSLLAFMAHPSDEAFSIGGTLALYARRGVKVWVVSATRGEVGEMDPALLEGYSSIADRRTSELNCAAQILGLTGVDYLGYRDSGMPGSPEYQHPNAFAAQAVEETAARVVHFIRLFKPQVIITHDPIGGYKHPDHIALNRAVRLGFDVASKPELISDLPPFTPQKLYYQTLPKELLRWAVKLAPLFRMDPRHFGRNGDIDLAALVVEGNFPTHARIDCRSVDEIRAQASACHVSQEGGGRRSGVLAIMQRILGTNESFMRAYPPAEKDVRERDLFEGVVSAK